MMARGKKKESTLTPEEKLAQALVPDWEQPYKVPGNWCWVWLPVTFENHTDSKKKVQQKTYLEDGRCSFTNNLSENAIRPFTVGRKNWLFSSSVDGANASAVVYTMVEMAKAHDLNIYEYLKYVLEKRPDQSWSDEQLSELVPWSENLQHLKNRM